MTSRPAVTTPSPASRIAPIALFVIVAGFALFAALWRPASTPVASRPALQPAAASLAGATGSVDEPAGEAVAGTAMKITGWALHPSGIVAVEARLPGRSIRARIGMPRPDVAQAHAADPASATSGFVVDVEAVDLLSVPGTDRIGIDVVAIGAHGGETLLGTRSLIAARATTRWQRYAQDGDVFHLLPALSGAHLGMAEGLERRYAAYASSTTRIGTRIPILYLRTTQGREGDYAFDPDWDIDRRCRRGADARRLSDDSLNGVIRYAVDNGVPILFTLNGGIWGDAACDMPQWDVNDLLEQDAANCQWSEKDEVVADDHLKNLAGAFDSPELARALTLNVYAAEVRRYKKRNLQQAAARIAQFASDHPQLFVGVTLEPDLYMNPFFGEQAWFDYNPATLRQFREWLAGSGPYAGKGGAGVPDLSKYRRRDPLTLRDVNRIGGRSYARWDDVEPPRRFPREGDAKFWDDAWTREWEHFRRHLVDLHYDELSQWVHEAGIPADRIWSAQGFMAPHPSAMPFALTVRSPVKNYDSGGMSVEGSKPAAGELGAILYGASAQNDIRMEGGRSLFATFRSFSRNWGVVEYNSADLRRPKELPTYADAYRGLREMWNHGARFVSPMAWPGSSGRYAGRPGYDPFTAWRDTPLEAAAKDFLLARMNLPLGSRLWTFGGSSHADTDGWTAEQGSIRSRPGHLVLVPDADGRVTLVSPGELALDAKRRWRVVVATASGSQSAFGVQVRDEGGGWREVRSIASGDASVGLQGRADAIRLLLRDVAGDGVAVTDVAVIPE